MYSLDRECLYIIKKVFALVRFCFLGVFFCPLLRQYICFSPQLRLLLRKCLFLKLVHLAVVLLLALFRFALLNFSLNALKNLATALKFIDLLFLFSVNVS